MNSITERECSGTWSRKYQNIPDWTHSGGRNHGLNGTIVNGKWCCSLLFPSARKQTDISAHNSEVNWYLFHVIFYSLI